MKHLLFNIMTVCVYPYLSYPARKSQIFLSRIILSHVTCLSYFSTLSR